MRKVHNYILLVDNYRRPSRRRNTAGRYRVAAKTPDEAVELLREKIKFGSIQIYYVCDPRKDRGKWLEYKQVRREVPTPGGFEHVVPRSAIDPLR